MRIRPSDHSIDCEGVYRDAAMDFTIAFRTGLRIRYLDRAGRNSSGAITFPTRRINAWRRGSSTVVTTK